MSFESIFGFKNPLNLPQFFWVMPSVARDSFATVVHHPMHALIILIMMIVLLFIIVLILTMLIVILSLIIVISLFNINTR
jgi:hypothetical protein